MELIRTYFSAVEAYIGGSCLSRGSFSLVVFRFAQYIVSKAGANQEGILSAAHRSSLLLCGVIDFSGRACPEGFVEVLLHRSFLSTVKNLTCGKTLHTEPLPDHIMNMIAGDGLASNLHSKLKMG
jgi:hypothetical protein